MHDTALIALQSLAVVYGFKGASVVDIGGLNINGSARADFERLGMRYTVVDMEEHPSVDIVVKPGEPLPFATGSIDIILSTSCFEHDPVFWITFKEMTRIVNPSTGIIYINAPAQGKYHSHPGDNWRFYQDAAQALAFWSGYEGNQYPVKVVETFHIFPKSAEWVDFVAIWSRHHQASKSIKLDASQKASIGRLQSYMINNFGLKCGHFDGVHTHQKVASAAAAAATSSTKTKTAHKSSTKKI